MQFSDFIAPFDAARFRAEYFGKLPVHLRSDGNSRPSLLNWSRFNQVLAIAPYRNEDSLKDYFKCRAALRESYCDTTELRAGTNAPGKPGDILYLQRNLERLERAGILVETEMQQ